MEEKNINDDHRKMLKMAAGLTTKVSFGSPRSSSPSVTEERPLSEATAAERGHVGSSDQPSSVEPHPGQREGCGGGGREEGQAEGE